MPRDRVYYLDPIKDTPTNVFSRLRELLRESKQNQAAASQWIGYIRGLTQKGVKQSEIEDVLAWLERRGGEKIRKDELLTYIEHQMPRIKVVDLASPKYSNYVSLNGEYTERLYILSSESMLIDDLIEDLYYRMEEIGFDPSPLITDPGLVDRMEQELKKLKEMRPKSWDFKNHHFSEVVKEHGKNLMAHARFVRQGGLFFIQEIQSDWAQRGRKNGWTGNFPRAPFVTQTEQWAGLVLKELVQTAARDASVQQVAWLRSNMRNGWDDYRENDGLSEFYDNILRRLMEKHLAKTDARIDTIRVVDKRGVEHDVLGFRMTEKARDVLSRAFPLYSRDALLPVWAVTEETEQEVRAEVLKQCEIMLGSAHMVRFYNRLYDAAINGEVAGRYWNQFIEVSLRAADPRSVARHEIMHFAYDNLLLPHEQLILDMEFFPGSDLYYRTQERLRQLGRHAAAEECRMNPKECMAYAFELWCKGDLDVRVRSKNIFEAVVRVCLAVGNWIRRVFKPHEGQTPEEIFDKLKNGILARRARVLEAIESETNAMESQDAASMMQR